MSNGRVKCLLEKKKMRWRKKKAQTRFLILFACLYESIWMNSFSLSFRFDAACWTKVHLKNFQCQIHSINKSNILHCVQLLLFFFISNFRFIYLLFFFFENDWFSKYSSIVCLGFVMRFVIVLTMIKYMNILKVNGTVSSLNESQRCRYLWRFWLYHYDYRLGQSFGQYLSLL